jgi:hypothetical protein
MWPRVGVVQHSVPIARARQRPSSGGTKRAPSLWITRTARPASLRAASSGRTARRSTPVSSRPIHSAPGRKKPGSRDSLRYCRSIMQPKSANGLSATTARMPGSIAAASSAVDAPIDAPGTPMRAWPRTRSTQRRAVVKRQAIARQTAA